ncbi:hypothetical protein [Lichenibacterium dinghuense]|jgi:hypothetical protein|uniref:hypothetical protein n=1 Tax=Lichenibacterium dinghuense TaxID=2895977 RepID=UPI001F1C9EC8|nr:hypothetical protein [Lichenibacterium sp. 6Y81]
MTRTRRALLTACLALPLGASAARAEAVTEPSLKGYGIKGVEAPTLPAMLARCAAARRGSAALEEGETPALLAARCDQLRRSVHNQPGNSPSAARR